jgi:UDP-3-O-[3-hydroxymyristoyl] glucosamine N-acyltransferase
MRLSELAEHVNGEILGEESLEITSVCAIENGVHGGVAFLANAKYVHHLDNTKASAVFVSRTVVNSSNTTLIQVDNPYMAYVQALRLFYQLPTPFADISPQAFIDPTATIANQVAIGPFAYIGKNVRIGKGSIIYPNAVLMDDVVLGENCRIYANVTLREGSRLGNRVCVQAGAVIGGDGFGFAPNPPSGFEKILQIGIVVLEDDVEIGANTCIDRAAIGETVIGKGTKLDNLIQIAHGVKIGQNNVMAALSGVAGSTKIGHWNQVGGNTSINGHITIGDQNTIAAVTGVVGSVKDKNVLAGMPARPLADFKRIVASEARLPQIIKELRELKKEVSELRKQIKK